MNIITRTILPLLLLAASTAWATPEALPDQFGNLISVADAHASAPDSILIVIVVSGRKLRLVKRWEEGLRQTNPNLISMRIADITDEPRPTHEQVAEKLRKRAPQGVSILIDLENQWANEFELDTNEPCLLLLDKNNQVVATFRGRANKDRLAEFSNLLEKWMPDSAASGEST